MITVNRFHFRLFILSLLLLIINDHYLKFTFPNIFTGKLSDFAGIACLYLFIVILTPGKKVTAALSIAIGFVFWKSALSSEFIAFWNHYAPFPIGRSIDLWDLTALIVIPLIAYFDAKDHITIRANLLSLQHIWSIPLYVLYIWAFMATSHSRMILTKNTFEAIDQKVNLHMPLPAFYDALSAHNVTYHPIDSLPGCNRIQSVPIPKNDTLESVLLHIEEKRNKIKIKILTITLRGEHESIYSSYPEMKNSRKYYTRQVVSFLKSIRKAP